MPMNKKTGRHTRDRAPKPLSADQKQVMYDYPQLIHVIIQIY